MFNRQKPKCGLPKGFLEECLGKSIGRHDGKGQLVYSKRDIIRSVFGFYSRRATKLEEAVDLYTRAANMFKMAQKWSGRFSQSLEQDVAQFIERLG